MLKFKLAAGAGAAATPHLSCVGFCYCNCYCYQPWSGALPAEPDVLLPAPDPSPAPPGPPGLIDARLVCAPPWSPGLIDALCAPPLGPPSVPLTDPDPDPDPGFDALPALLPAPVFFAPAPGDPGGPERELLAPPASTGLGALPASWLVLALTGPATSWPPGRAVRCAFLL